MVRTSTHASLLPVDPATPPAGTRRGQRGSLRLSCGVDLSGFWKATSASCSSPLLVLVNSKSGDNQGVKFLRKFKQLLNPAQVFDLMNGGPELGYGGRYLYLC